MDHVPDTQPYPWPYDGDLDGRRYALVVAGAQAHWLARSVDTTAVLANLTALAGAVRSSGGIVVALRHGRSPALADVGHRPRLPTTRTEGWQLCLGGLSPDHVVDTTGLNGFHGSELDALLGGLGRDHLLFGGFCAELTVDTTLRSANDRGYESLVVTDACAFVDPAVGAHAHSSVTMSGGIFGALGTSTAVSRALSDRTRDRSRTPPMAAPSTAPTSAAT
ncbi:MAG TPA: cysteine hydrolase [Acidimicrobiales bacterium]